MNYIRIQHRSGLLSLSSDMQLIAAFFASVALSILTRNFFISPFFLAAATGVSVYSAYRFIRKTFLPWGYIGIACIASLCSFAGIAYFLPHVQFWGDEVGVLEIAALPFTQVVSQTMSQHFGSMPLDPLLMWVWLRIVSVPLFSGYPIEVLYRVPYLFYHVGSAILFACAVILPLSHRSSSRYAIGVAAAGIFSVFPVLTAYAAETRFFGLSVFGYLLTYLFYRTKHISPSTLPILLIFCLNSPFHLYVLGTVSLLLFIHRDFRACMMLIVSTLILCTFVLPSVSVFEMVKPLPFLQAAAWLWSQASEWVFPETMGTFLLLTLSVLGFFAMPTVWLETMAFPLFFLVFFAVSYLVKPYSYVYLRHILPAIAFFPMTAFFSLKHLRKISLCTVLTGLVFCVGISWWQQSREMYRSGIHFPAKIHRDAKGILDTAMAEQLMIIVPPDNGTDWYYGFYLHTFAWYSSYYRGVRVYYAKTPAETCAMFENYQRSIIYNLSRTVRCGTKGTVYNYNEFQIRHTGSK